MKDKSKKGEQKPAQPSDKQPVRQEDLENVAGGAQSGRNSAHSGQGGKSPKKNYGGGGGSRSTGG